MLTEETLIKQFNADHSKGLVGRLAAQIRADGFDLKRLIDLTFHSDAQTGFRAGWLLDVTMLTYPEYYTEQIPYLVKRMPDVTNESCKRHYTRIMMHLTGSKMSAIIKQKLAEIDLEPVVETCFDWMIDAKTKVAVQAFAADVLFNLIPRYDWIQDELENQIHFMMRTGSAAIQSRGKRLLKDLAALKNKAKA